MERKERKIKSKIQVQEEKHRKVREMEDRLSMHSIPAVY